MRKSMRRTLIANKKVRKVDNLGNNILEVNKEIIKLKNEGKVSKIIGEYKYKINYINWLAMIIFFVMLILQSKQSTILSAFTGIFVTFLNINLQNINYGYIQFLNTKKVKKLVKHFLIFILIFYAFLCSITYFINPKFFYLTILFCLTTYIVSIFLVHIFKKIIQSVEHS